MINFQKGNIFETIFQTKQNNAKYLYLQCTSIIYYLCSNVSILFSVTITVVGIDIVTPNNSIYWLKNNSTVVISNHIGISKMREEDNSTWIQCVELRTFKSLEGSC